MAGGKATAAPGTAPEDEAPRSGSAAGGAAGGAESSGRGGGDSSRPLAANGRPIGWSFLPREEPRQEAAQEPPAAARPAEQVIGF